MMKLGGLLIVLLIGIIIHSCVQIAGQILQSYFKDFFHFFGIRDFDFFKDFSSLFRMNFTHSLKPFCLTWRRLHTHGSIYKQQNENISKSTKSEWALKKRNDARRSLWWGIFFPAKHMSIIFGRNDAWISRIPQNVSIDFRVPAMNYLHFSFITPILPLLKKGMLQPQPVAVPTNCFLCK